LYLTQSCTLINRKCVLLAGPYFLSFPERDASIYGYGWQFPTNVATQMLIAAKLAAANETEASAWRDMAAMQLHYIMGVNPQGFSMITGVGARRFTNPVDQESVYDDWVSAALPVGQHDGDFNVV
jgi:hypothetical protein